MPLKVLSRTSAAVESAKPRKPSSITLPPTGSPHPREALWCSRHSGGYSDWMDDWPSIAGREQLAQKPDWHSR